MDVLESRCVFIDRYPRPAIRACHRAAPLLLLTHKHTDSTRELGPNNTNPVHGHCPTCSTRGTGPTLNQCGAKLCLDVVPGRVYRRKGKQTFVAFCTEHTKDSLGYWFPKLGVLYCGDGRVTHPLLRHLLWLTGPLASSPGPVRYLVGDTLYEDVPRVPRVADSRQVLRALLAAAARTGARQQPAELDLVVVHSGVSDFLGTGFDCTWQVSPGDWQGHKLLPAARELAARAPKKTGAAAPRSAPRVRLLPPGRKRIASGLLFETLPTSGLRSVRNWSGWTLLPSSLWFVVNGVDAVRHPLAVERRHKVARLFVSFHCAADEIRRLRAAFPRADFEGCPSRPL